MNILYDIKLCISMIKVIVDKKNKINTLYHVKNSLRNITILLSYTLGFCVYSLLFQLWSIDSFLTLSWWWLVIPILGFLTGIIHLGFIYKGSLICKAFVMFCIMFYVFVLPFVIAMVN